MRSARNARLVRERVFVVSDTRHTWTPGHQDTWIPELVGLDSEGFQDTRMEATMAPYMTRPTLRWIWWW